MNPITLQITTKEQKIDIVLQKELKCFSELFQYLKKELAIKNDYDIFVKLQENQTQLLTSANFKKFFIEEHHSIIPLIIFENPNLDSQMQSIITEYEFEEGNINKHDNNNNFIEGLSILSSESRVIESKWINNTQKNNTNQRKATKIFTDKCSCCHTELISLKFLCLICDLNTSILCEKCEENHEHPVIKYKSLDFASNINDIITFRTSSQNPLMNIFKKPIDISTHVNYPITTQGKRKIIFPLVINWNGNEHFDYKVIIRNFRDLQTGYEIEEINKKSSTTNINVSLIPTVYSMGKYAIKIELYFMEHNKHTNTVNIDFEVNEDKEEEALNDYFEEYPKIMLLPVKHKQIMKLVHQENISTKPIIEIYQILYKHKWSVESALEELL